MSEDLTEMFRTFNLSEGDKKMTLKFLIYLDQPTLEKAGRGLPLKALFDCLNTSDEEQFELASAALRRFLSLMPLVEALEKYGDNIHIALSHPSATVKKSFLSYLEKNISADSLMLLCTSYTKILRQVLEYLAWEDRAIAEGSVALFKSVGKDSVGRKIMFSNEFVVALKRIMDVNDITRFRIYEIVVELCRNSKEALDLAHQSGILPSLLHEVKSPDTIIQLNGLELLTPFAFCSHCLDYLEEQECIKFLVHRLLQLKDDTLSVILLPGFIEFFGHLFAAKPLFFLKRYPEVMQLLFECFESVDPALKAVAINALARIGATDEGKRMLLTEKDNMIKLCHKLGAILKCQNDLGMQSMVALCALLATSDSELQSVCVTWFENMGIGTIDAVFHAARLPFPEPCLVALRLIKCLAEQPWGVEKVCNTPGILEFLMDRNFKRDTSCTHIAFEIIQLINRSPKLEQLVSHDLVNSMKQFLSEGAFYVRSDPQVSFMESS